MPYVVSGGFILYIEIDLLIRDGQKNGTLGLLIHGFPEVIHFIWLDPFILDRHILIFLDQHIVYLLLPIGEICIPLQLLDVPIVAFVAMMISPGRSK